MCGHEVRVEAFRVLQHCDVGQGIAASGEADKAALTGLPGGLERLDRATGSEDFLDIGQADAMDLPEIEVIRLHRFQREMQFLLRLPGCALVALTGKEDVLAEGRNGAAIDLLAEAVTVGVRHVEIVDSEVVCATHDGYAILHRNHVEAGASHADAGESGAGFSQGAHRNIAGLSFGGSRGRGAYTGKCGANEGSSSHESSPFEEEASESRRVKCREPGPVRLVRDH